MPTLTVRGTSSSARATRGRALAIFKLFQDARPGQPYSQQAWDALPADVVCNNKLYEDFAFYLLSEYTFTATNRGTTKHLTSSTALPYLNNLLHAAEEKYYQRCVGFPTRDRVFLLLDSTTFSGITFYFSRPKCEPDTSGFHPHSHIAFFQCFDTGSTKPQAQWLKGLRQKLVRLHFERATKNGEEHDHSATPVYLAHVRKIQRSLAKVGTPEDALRKLAILTLQVRTRNTYSLKCIASYDASCVHCVRPSLWVSGQSGRAPLQRCAGRSGEVGALTIDGMTYDPEFGCVYVEVPQWKSAKSKHIALVAGADRHCDWFTAWADFLVMQEGRQPIPLEEQGNVALWLFPELSPDNTSSAGTKVGSWIQALRPGGVQRYKKVWIPELPDGVSAGMLNSSVSVLLCEPVLPIYQSMCACVSVFMRS